jgi:ATP-dependent DNA ligase
VSSGRFRHGTALMRWRPDKDPKQCTYQQLAPELRPSQIAELFGAEAPDAPSKRRPSLSTTR